MKECERGGRGRRKAGEKLSHERGVIINQAVSLLPSIIAKIGRTITSELQLSYRFYGRFEYPVCVM